MSLTSKSAIVGSGKASQVTRKSISTSSCPVEIINVRPVLGRSSAMKPRLVSVPSPCDHFRGVEHSKSYNLMQVSASASFCASRNGQSNVATSVDLHLFLSETMKIKALGLLTHIAGKSVSRRFPLCNPPLLIPKTSQAHGRFTFLLGEASSGQGQWRQCLISGGILLSHNIN